MSDDDFDRNTGTTVRPSSRERSETVIGTVAIAGRGWHSPAGNSDYVTFEDCVAFDTAEQYDAWLLTPDGKAWTERVEAKRKERIATARMVAAAQETERLREAAEQNPTKENNVLHAVQVWRQGCTHGGPGDCPECDALFLEVIGKHLAGEEIEGPK